MNSTNNANAVIAASDIEDIINNALAELRAGGHIAEIPQQEVSSTPVEPDIITRDEAEAIAQEINRAVSSMNNTVINVSTDSEIIDNDEEEDDDEVEEEPVPPVGSTTRRRRSSGTLERNSGSILVDEKTSRFSSAIWFQKLQEQTIVVAGIGGIGSYVSFLLSRLNPRKIIMYDADNIEVGNLSGQLFSLNQVGLGKVDAMNSFMSQYSDYHEVYSIHDRFTEQTAGSNIMICGFDNMEARKTFYKAWKKNLKNASDKSVCLFIDGRLAAEELQIFCIQGNDDTSMKKYEKDFLFDDSEADETICSYKQTSFMATMIGSLIVNLFVNFVANMCNPIIPRDLPFMTSYSGETMYFKVIS